VRNRFRRPPPKRTHTRLGINLRSGDTIVLHGTNVTITEIVGSNSVLNRLTVDSTIGRLELKPYQRYVVEHKNSLIPPRTRRI